MNLRSPLAALFLTFIPALALGQADMRAGFVLVQERPKSRDAGENFTFFAVDAVGGGVKKIHSTGPLPFNRGLYDMTAPHAGVSMPAQTMIGPIHKLLVLDNPGAAHPTAFMTDMSNSVYALTAHTSGTSRLSYGPSLRMTDLCQISRTQGLGIDPDYGIYHLSHDGKAEQLLPGNWAIDLFSTARVRLIAPLEVKSANPLIGTFAVTSDNGDVAVVAIDSSKMGARRAMALLIKSTPQRFEASHLLVRQDQLVVVGYKLIGEALYYDHSLRELGHVQLDLSNTVRGLVRGMPTYATHSMKAEILGISGSALYGQAYIHVRNGNNAGTTHPSSSYSPSTPGLYTGTNFIPGFNAATDDIISHFPAMNLPLAIALENPSVDTSVASTQPDWKAAMTGISANLAILPPRLVDDAVPTNLEEWARFLIEEQKGLRKQVGAPFLATDSRPTVREFIAAVQRTPRLLSIVANNLKYDDRKAHGFFWKNPGFRALSPYTVDTDTVDVSALLMQISARTSCEAALRLKPQSP
jgi:hypothetical protein